MLSKCGAKRPIVGVLNNGNPERCDIDGEVLILVGPSEVKEFPSELTVEIEAAVRDHSAFAPQLLGRSTTYTRAFFISRSSSSFSCGVNLSKSTLGLLPFGQRRLLLPQLVGAGLENGEGNFGGTSGALWLGWGCCLS